MIINQIQTLINKYWPYEYELVVTQYQNEEGTQSYPLMSVELPILSESERIDFNSILFNGTLTVYVVDKRVSMTNDEDRQLIDNCFNLLNNFVIAIARDNRVNVARYSVITYSGVERGKFSDDVSGVIGTINFTYSVSC